MNTKSLIAVLVALLIGAGSGYAIGQSASTDDTTDTVEMHAEADDHSDDMAMEHDHSTMPKFEVEASQAPSAELMVAEDAKSGWNVTIKTSNFTFTPEDVNTDNVVGEGHMHLYVDGEKVARLYGPDYHYSENFDGEKEFMITFNANDHSEYAVDGEVVMAKVTASHDHSDGDDTHSDAMMSDDDMEMTNQ